MIQGSIFNTGLSQTRLNPPGGFAVGGPGNVKDETSMSGARTGFLSGVMDSGGQQFLGQPLVWFIGLFAFLGLAKWFGEHPKTPINPEHVHVGGYNFFTVGVIAIVFIAASKLILNRYPVPGLYQVVNSV